MKKTITNYFLKVDNNPQTQQRKKAKLDGKNTLDIEELDANNSDPEPVVDEIDHDGDEPIPINSESEDENPTKNKKRTKKVLQSYATKWETVSSFKPWLSKSSKGQYFGRCKVCDKDLKISNSGISALEVHMESKGHKILMSEVKSNTSQPEINFVQQIPFDRQVLSFIILNLFYFIF